MGQALAGPERQLQPCLQIKEGHRPMLELCADDALCSETQPVAIEPERPFQIVDADGDHGDSRFHAIALPRGAARTNTRAINAGSACVNRIVVFAVTPPNTPATTTQPKKNTLTSRRPVQRPQNNPAARK